MGDYGEIKAPLKIRLWEASVAPLPALSHFRTMEIPALPEWLTPVVIHSEEWARLAGLESAAIQLGETGLAQA
jgi:hypothetical protein